MCWISDYMTACALKAEQSPLAVCNPEEHEEQQKGFQSKERRKNGGAEKQAALCGPRCKKQKCFHRGSIKITECVRACI